MTKFSKSLSTVTLDSISESIVDGPFGSNLKTSDYVSSGIPVLQGKNITGNSFEWKEIRYITKKKAESLSRSAVVLGDHLLIKIGSIGYSAILDDLHGHAYAIIPANLARVRPDRKKVDDQYLHHFLTSTTATRYFTKVASKTAQPALSLSKIKALEIPLPPLAEQKRIAGILDAADALRAKRRESIAQLDALLQSTFLEMFGDPVTNPKGWEKCVLGDVIHSAKDGPHVSPDYVSDGIPFLSTRHIKPGEILWKDLKYLDEDEAKRQWKKCKPERDDILYTKGGTTGIAARVTTDKDFAVWVHVALLKPNHDLVNVTWLESMLNSDYCYTQSQRYTHGIANRDLGLTRMIKILMYNPPRRLQEKYSNFVDNVDKQRALLRKHYNELDALFASLQHRAFNGEL